MDPFMGSGTTALVCKMRGIDSIGYDIMPISSISLKAKAVCTDYDLEEIRDLIEDIKKIEIPQSYQGKLPYINITKYAYPEETEKFLQYISE